MLSFLASSLFNISAYADILVYILGMAVNFIKYILCIGLPAAVITALLYGTVNRAYDKKHHRIRSL